MAESKVSLIVELIQKGKKVLQNVSKGLGDVEKAAKKVRTAAQEASTAGLRIAAIGTAITAAFALPVREAAKLEKVMSNVLAITGATEIEFAKLTETARELGRTTKFTAEQAASGMQFMAFAGFKATEIVAAMPAVLNLAAAANLQLAESADITTNILKGYGLEVSQLNEANDILVKTFTSTNTNLLQLGQAFKFVGPIAARAGVSFSEASAALGILGNTGIQATLAGTSVRRMLTGLLKPTKKAQRLLDQLGITVNNQEGNFVGLANIIQQFEKAFENVGSRAEQTGIIMEIFGLRGGPGMAALIAEGSDAIRDLTLELEGAAGITDRIAKVQMQNLFGAITLVTSAISGLAIALGQPFLQVLADIFRQFARFINWLTEIKERLGAYSDFIFASVGALGILTVAAGAVITVFAGIAGAIANSILFLKGFGAVVGKITPKWLTFDKIVKSFSRSALTLVNVGNALSFVLAGLKVVIIALARAALPLLGWVILPNIIYELTSSLGNLQAKLNKIHPVLGVIGLALDKVVNWSIRVLTKNIIEVTIWWTKLHKLWLRSYRFALILKGGHDRQVIALNRQIEALNTETKVLELNWKTIKENMKARQEWEKQALTNLQILKKNITAGFDEVTTQDEVRKLFESRKKQLKELTDLAKQQLDRQFADKKFVTDEQKKLDDDYEKYILRLKKATTGRLKELGYVELVNTGENLEAEIQQWKEAQDRKLKLAEERLKTQDSMEKLAVEQGTMTELEALQSRLDRYESYWSDKLEVAKDNVQKQEKLILSGQEDYVNALNKELDARKKHSQYVGEIDKETGAERIHTLEEVQKSYEKTYKDIEDGLRVHGETVEIISDGELQTRKDNMRDEIVTVTDGVKKIEKVREKSSEEIKRIILDEDDVYQDVLLKMKTLQEQIAQARLNMELEISKRKREISDQEEVAEEQAHNEELSRIDEEEKARARANAMRLDAISKGIVMYNKLAEAARQTTGPAKDLVTIFDQFKGTIKLGAIEAEALQAAMEGTAQDMLDAADALELYAQQAVEHSDGVDRLTRAQEAARAVMLLREEAARRMAMADREAALAMERLTIATREYLGIATSAQDAVSQFANFVEDLDFALNNQLITQEQFNDTLDELVERLALAVPETTDLYQAIMEVLQAFLMGTLSIEEFMNTLRDLAGPGADIQEILDAIADSLAGHSVTTAADAASASIQGLSGTFVGALGAANEYLKGLSSLSKGLEGLVSENLIQRVGHFASSFRQSVQDSVKGLKGMSFPSVDNIGIDTDTQQSVLSSKTLNVNNKFILESLDQESILRVVNNIIWPQIETKMKQSNYV